MQFAGWDMPMLTASSSVRVIAARIGLQARSKKVCFAAGYGPSSLVSFLITIL